MHGDAPVFRGCPKCGGSLAAETLHGARALGCLHCDAITLTRADLAAMLEGDAVTEEAETDTGPYALINTPTPGPARTSQPPKRGGIHWAIVLTVALFTSAGGLVAGAGVVLIATKLGGIASSLPLPEEPVLPGAVAVASEEPVVADPAAVAVVDPSSEPAVATDPVVATDPGVVTDPAAVVEPVAAVEPVAIQPVAPPPVKKKSPLDRGWKAVDNGDLFTAKDAFEEAYLADPNNGEAAYALGYALYNLGKAAEAKTYLCQAVHRPLSVDTSREVTGLLTQIGTPCP